MKENSKVLLHACCGICSGYPIVHLRELGYEPVVYFYNSNLFPEEEHAKRLEAQKTLCDSMKCELIEEDYEPELYKEEMKGLETSPEGGARCKKCFELRLNKAAQKAYELGLSYFTTTLAVSPHKNFQVVSEVGNAFAHCFKLNYLAIDFKKKDGVLKTNRIAKELGLYRQSYCGCLPSLKEYMQRTSGNSAR